MGNRPLGKNCGNTTWTQECCGDVIGYQEICGDLEYCDHLVTAGDIRRRCKGQEGTWTLIVLLVVALCFGCYALYRNRYRIEDSFTNMRKKGEPRASDRPSESEVKNLLDDSFKL